jgi:hypothetical protein
MKRGRILKIRLGVNPNSSSIGSDLSIFLMTATAATLLVNLVDAGVRLWWRRRKTGAPS